MANSEIFLISQPNPSATAEIIQVDEAERQGGLQLDAVTRYASSRRFRTTDHVIPSGGVVSDHVITAPLAFNMTGVLTPYHVITPLRVLVPTRAAIDSVRTELNNAASSGIEAVVRKRDQLVQFAEEHTALTIVGNDFNYNNMVIVSLNTPKTVSDGRAVPVTIQFKRVRVAPKASAVPPLVDEDAQKLGTEEPEVDDNFATSRRASPNLVARRTLPA